MAHSGLVFALISNTVVVFVAKPPSHVTWAARLDV